MKRRLTARLRHTRTAPRAARAKLADFDHGLPSERLCDAELLLSELVSNAVKYGGEGDISVTFERADDRFRTEVVDQGDGFLATLRDAGEGQRNGGWGLPLVQRLSDRWGAYAGSTRVWFEFAL
jgi:anti-sigma regulatory factor (Ser/Thr protein kinase)